MLQMDLIKVNGNQMEIKETYKILLVMILYPNSLGEWGYKYNPYILNQINQLGKEYGEVTDEDIYNIIRKQNFSGMHI